MSDGGSAPQAAVIMATRNRCDVLRLAIQAAQSQTVPVDIIVMDDASTDGTAAMMQSEFPAVRYERSISPVGPCVLRNRASRLTKAPILFLLDDDSVLASPRTVEQTLHDFAGEPRVGAVAIPVINVNQNSNVSFRAPDDAAVHVIAEYLGASRALRSDVYRQLDGERETFFYMGEENDLCTRMLEAGYVVRLGSADPIEHLESTHRVSSRVHFYGQRNNILYSWYNVPMPDLLIHLPATIVKGMWAATRAGWIGQNVRGTISGLLTILRNPMMRHPVRRKTYLAYRRLRRGELSTLNLLSEALR